MLCNSLLLIRYSQARPTAYELLDLRTGPDELACHDYISRQRASVGNGLHLLDYCSQKFSRKQILKADRHPYLSTHSDYTCHFHPEYISFISVPVLNISGNHSCKFSRSSVHSDQSVDNP